MRNVRVRLLWVTAARCRRRSGAAGRRVFDSHLGRSRLISQLLEREVFQRQHRMNLEAWEQGRDLDHARRPGPGDHRRVGTWRRPAASASTNPGDLRDANWNDRVIDKAQAPAAVRRRAHEDPSSRLRSRPGWNCGPAQRASRREALLDQLGELRSDTEHLAGNRPPRSSPIRWTAVGHRPFRPPDLQELAKVERRPRPLAEHVVQGWNFRGARGLPSVNEMLASVSWRCCASWKSLPGLFRSSAPPP
ncbi:hypothetical protein ACPA9J_31570 [Pseudomonas aeruginosa]